jgi:hypothetical protein
MNPVKIIATNLGFKIKPIDQIKLLPVDMADASHFMSSDFFSSSQIKGE